jgi:hypothetical protein
MALAQADNFDEWEDSGRRPTQLLFFHTHNWDGSDSDPGCGQWLWCMKDTTAGTRQFIVDEEAVVAVVTFAPWVRHPRARLYEGWGSITRLANPVSRGMLLRDPRTRGRFDERGQHALQGGPIRLSRLESKAIIELAGGLPRTLIPQHEPDYSEEPSLWVGSHGLAPEAYIEAAVAATPRLWRELGFPSAPRRQRRLGDAGRPDLLAGDVVGEAKREVRVRDGAIEQLERYLDFLHRRHGRQLHGLKGVLFQCAERTNDAVINRLRASRYRLELWAVIDDDGWWYAEKLA